MSRVYLGELYGLPIYEDTLCPKDNAYLMPEMEVIVPTGQKITKTIEDSVRDNKDRILKVEFKQSLDGGDGE